MITTTKLFHYIKDKKTLVAEMSDFGGAQFHQVYPDSCDEGLTLVSHVTGKEVDYVVNHTEKDKEGEIQFWELIPTKPSIRRVPAAKGTKIKIFND